MYQKLSSKAGSKYTNKLNEKNTNLLFLATIISRGNSYYF